ncbi:WAT1-related protein At2g39510-like [Tripterygium wilfordii]|uniref:WAT1-related protein At2g39510-like n=1 Tax=Tripterygium wilfordii TaxID=458696 RepID=UPI0018F7FBD4|nr:WAT1-related protein At2g39510-like [Tripterygium wilfordii]
MESFAELMNQAKPYLLVIFLQWASGVLNIIAKAALNHGMSQHVLVVYRMAVASALIAPFAFFLERKSRPKMTLPIFSRIMLLSLLEPMAYHNLFYPGMKHTTANFGAAMFNIVPAITFIRAWIFSLESIYLTRLSSQAKVVGTIVTIGGAMLMSLVKGQHLNFPKINKGHVHQIAANKGHFTEGVVMIVSACFIGSAFLVLQAITLKSYPANLSLVALQCIMGMVESIILALAVEWGNSSVWCIYKDGIKLGSTSQHFGIAGTRNTRIHKTAFNFFDFSPGNIFCKNTNICRILRAFVIIVGLYLVVWGKSKDQIQQPEIDIGEPIQEATTMNGDRDTPTTDTENTEPNQDAATNKNSNIGDCDQCFLVVQEIQKRKDSDFFPPKTARELQPSLVAEWAIEDLIAEARYKLDGFHSWSITKIHRFGCIMVMILRIIILDSS